MGNHRTFDARPGGAAARWSAASNDRRVLNGIFFVLRTGTPWRDLPERYGPYTTAYNRFNRWAKQGVWVRALRDARRPLAGLDAIDRQLDCPRAPARRRRKKGADHAIGRSRGGLSTKINARVDGRGLPVRLTLTAGQAHDRRAVAELLPGLPPGSAVVADRSYDSRLVHALIEAAGAQPQIPTPRRRRVQRSVDPALYRQRNPRRALLQQAQTLPANSHALRENRP